LTVVAENIDAWPPKQKYDNATRTMYPAALSITDQIRSEATS